MQFRVFLNDQNKIMCNVPPLGKDVPLMELVLGVSLYNTDQFKEKFGKEMPEIIIDFPIDENNKEHQQCLKYVEAVEKELHKKYLK